MNMMEATQIARQSVETVTGKVFENVSYCRKDGDNWMVGVEIIDNKARISDNDVVAEYEVIISVKSGDLVSYSRKRRYNRSHGAADAA